MKRLFLFALALFVILAFSGCVGLQKADFINAKMVPITNPQGDHGSAFSFSSTKFSRGTWQGTIIDGFANGSGSLVMMDEKGRQSGIFDGTLQNGKATGLGVLQFGAFDNGGQLTNPVVIYNGSWQNGLPYGGGKMEVYEHDGRLAYFLQGNFKNGTVDGPYFQFNPKQGAWISSFNDSDNQKTFVIE